MVHHEIQNVNRDAGYRQMKTILLQKHKMHVWQSTVAHVMKDIDPEGVHLRKKGKSKRRIYYHNGTLQVRTRLGLINLLNFGLVIHGAVDVWSGKFIYIFTGC